MPPRQAKILLVVCVISLVTLWACRLPKLCGSETGPYQLLNSNPVQKNLDLSRADAPFIAWPLARICRESSWVPDLVFVCDNNSGGLGNIRNYILTCVRYAISAGASGLIMPRIQSRSEDNLSQLFRGYEQFNYFFDEFHLRQALGTACPQITIYNEDKDVPGYSQDIRVESITPNHYGSRGGCDRRDLNRHVDLFGPRFRDSLEESKVNIKVGQQPIGHQIIPRLIRLTWGVQWNYPVYRDGSEFVATFGGILKFRADILQLGQSTVAAMVRHSSSPHGGSDMAAEYLGIHLRTENDALKGWPNFTQQTSAYMAKASEIGHRAAYLATGNLTEASKLKEIAMSENQIRVFNKQELLAASPGDLKLLESLTWDQQSLVDYIVLLSSSYFLGVSPSSFSMNVALKRHLKFDGLYTRPWKIGMAEDERSWLVGKYQHYWDDWLFMYDSLWP